MQKGGWIGGGGSGGKGCAKVLCHGDVWFFTFKVAGRCYVWCMISRYLFACAECRRMICVAECWYCVRL